MLDLIYESSTPWLPAEPLDQEAPNLVPVSAPGSDVYPQSTRSPAGGTRPPTGSAIDPGPTVRPQPAA
jgi:hypothetical protein